MAPAHPVPAPANPHPPLHRTPLFAALVIAAAALVAYHNSFGVPFVFDDELAILWGEQLPLRFPGSNRNRNSLSYQTITVQTHY